MEKEILTFNDLLQVAAQLRDEIPGPVVPVIAI